MPNSSVIASTGINNQYNMGGFYGQTPISGSGVIAYGSTGNNTPIRPLKIQFINQSGIMPVMNGLGGCAFELECIFYNPSVGWGQTSCSLIVFPSALMNNWGSNGSTIYNINNKINGNGNFIYSDATYAPFGRQYWTYNQYFSGVSGANAYLQGTYLGGGIYEIDIYFQIPNGWINFYYWIKNLSTNTAQTNNNGVLVYS